MGKRKIGNLGCLPIIIFLLIAFFSSMIGTISDDIKAEEKLKYHKSMIALSDPSSIAVTGDKIIAHVENDIGNETQPIFSTEYVPEGYETDVPEAVRYILYCHKYSEFVGTYSNGGGIGKVIMVEIQIFDRMSNQTIAAEEFRGGNPPHQVRTGGTHYGSEPDMTAIENWILSCISSNTATNQNAYATVYAIVPADWFSPGCWAWSSEGVDAFDAWPGEPMTLQDGWYTISVPAWIDNIIINANNGSVQTADLPVESGRNVWVTVDNSGTVQVFYENPLN